MQTIIYYALFFSLISPFSLSLYVGPFNQVLNRLSSISSLKEKNAKEQNPFLCYIPFHTCAHLSGHTSSTLQALGASVYVLSTVVRRRQSCFVPNISQKLLSPGSLLVSPNCSCFGFWDNQLPGWPQLLWSATSPTSWNHLCWSHSSVLFHTLFTASSPYMKCDPFVDIYRKTETKTVVYIQISLQSPHAVLTLYQIGLHITHSRDISFLNLIHSPNHLLLTD